MDQKDNFDELDGEIDEAKRDTLRKLGRSAWMAPAVATFALATLNTKSAAWAQAANGPVAS